MLLKFTPFRKYEKAREGGILSDIEGYTFYTENEKLMTPIDKGSIPGGECLLYDHWYRNRTL